MTRTALAYPRSALALAAAALVAVVTGCAPSAPVASPTPTPVLTTAAPTPTPVPDEPEPAALLLTGTGFTIVDDDASVLFEHAWNGPITDATEELTLLFGEPETSTSDPNSMSGGHLELIWGSFQFRATAAFEQTIDGDQVHSWVMVQQPEIAGIAIRTTSGASVGMTVDEIVALGARPAPEVQYATDPVDPALLESLTEPTEVVSVRVDSAGKVFELYAPQSSFGNL